MKNVTAVLISFLRPEYTKECVRSLRQSYPEIKIIVAENAERNEDLRNFVQQHGGQYFLMPYDSGVCFARNRLVALAQTEYVLVGDDDFYYEPDPGVDKMLKFLESHPDISLLGGRIFERGHVLDYQGNIEIYPDHLEYKHLSEEKNQFDEHSGLTWQACDITFNFFLARKKDIAEVMWDEKIKVAFEHSDWFISLKRQGIKVAYTPDVIVKHKPEHVKIKDQNKYLSYRMRRSDMDYFFDKHKISYSVGFRGTRTHADPIEKRGKLFYATVAMTFNGRDYNKGDIVETEYPNENMTPCW